MATYYIAVQTWQPPTGAPVGALQVSDATPMPVTLAAAVSHVIIDSGAITANAGTNLNTSALALEAGGNLAAILADTADMEVDLDAINAVSGTTAGAAVITDVNGTLQQYLRGLVKLWGAGLAAGTAVIGHVIVDSGVITTVSTVTAVTTVSTVTAVTAITNALPTGSNIIGRVGIDQTTPGTTNLVALAANQSVNLAQWAGGTAINSGVTGAAAAGGDTASGSTDAGNPVKTGGLAKTVNPTAVSTGQRVASLYDKLGKQVVVGALRELKAQKLTTITSSTAETTIVAAGAAGVFNDLYGLIIANTSATATFVTLKDATAGTSRSVIYIPAGETRGFMLPVDSAIPQTTAANNWTATVNDSVASIQITALTIANT